VILGDANAAEVSEPDIAAVRDFAGLGVPVHQVDAAGSVHGSTVT
jgi:hypothetical protein